MSRQIAKSVRSFPKGHNGYRYPTLLKVFAELNYIKGNSAPYFSLTYEVSRKGFPDQVGECGVGHEQILKYFPKYADLAALHLSDIDGRPMHGVANGWYWLAGSLANTGEKYHGRNQKMNFPCAAPADKPWQTTEYREPTRDECLDIFAKSWRISADEARRIQRRLAAIGHLADLAKETVRQALDDEVAKLVPVWKAQAEACIAHHDLRVTGDAWGEVAA